MTSCVVHKHVLPASGLVTVHARYGRWVSAAMQNGEIVAWLLVSNADDHRTRDYEFMVVETGMVFPRESWEHLETVTSSNGIVWHILVRVNRVGMGNVTVRVNP